MLKAFHKLVFGGGIFWYFEVSLRGAIFATKQSLKKIASLPMVACNDTNLKILIFLFFFVLFLNRIVCADQAPFQKGETIIYDIKKMGVKAGEASLTFHGSVRIDNREALLLVFAAKALNFYDEEKIYLNPQTFYPIKVQREVDLWGKKESITEEYNKEKGEVRIIKNAEGKKSEQVISKKGVLDNVYGFIYRYRLHGQFIPGELLTMNLPTKDLKIRFLSDDKIKILDKQITAYYLESDPKQYRIWLDRSANKVPLRIDGAIGLGKTSMIMKSYKVVEDLNITQGEIN